MMKRRAMKEVSEEITGGSSGRGWGSFYRYLKGPMM